MNPPNPSPQTPRVTYWVTPPVPFSPYQNPLSVTYWVTRPLAAALLLLAAPAALHAAFTVGGSAYTKRLETPALAEPAPLAPEIGRFAYGRELRVLEVRGKWLQVAEGRTTGWVFAGNLAEEKPREKNALGDSPLLASETSAAAAARPLAPAAVDYGARRNLAPAQADLEWVVAQSDAVTPAAVTTYLQAAKKGEYAE